MRMIPNATVGSTAHYDGVDPGTIVLNKYEQKMSWTGYSWELVKPIKEQAGLGMRFNTGKMRFDLIPGSWLRVLAQILTKGSDKYAPRNWEKGLSWSDTLGSLHRHLNAWMTGEMYDKETKCHHLGHVAWNALALMTMQIRGIGKSDIPNDTDETMKE